MYNLLISLGIGFATAVASALFLPHWYEWVLPALVAAAVAWFLGARRINRRLEAIFMKSMQDLQAQRPEVAIQTLKDAYALDRWQFLVRAQVDAQIGTILYLLRRNDEAEAHLRRGFVRHWLGQGMLACLLFRRHKLDEAKGVLEKAVAVTRKEPLLYGLYAFMLDKAGRKEEAIGVLQRGVAAVPGNAPLKDNLLALQNHRRIEMSGFGDAWYQFMLEPVPQARIQQMQQQQGMVARPGFRPGRAPGMRAR